MSNTKAIEVGDVFERPQPSIGREFGDPFRRYRVLEVNHDSVVLRQEYASGKSEHIRIAVPGYWPTENDLPVFAASQAYSALCNKCQGDALAKSFNAALEALAPEHVSYNYREHARNAAEAHLRNISGLRDFGGKAYDVYLDECRYVAESHDELWDAVPATQFDMPPQDINAVANLLRRAAKARA